MRMTEAHILILCGKSAKVLADTVVRSLGNPYTDKKTGARRNSMAKQYGQKREAVKDAPPVALKSIVGGSKVRNAPDRRAADRGHTGQLLWSFAVAICLVLAALLQWTVPRNALMDQDRAPAQIRFETVNTSMNGS
jgi:hypothetical protein